MLHVCGTSCHLASLAARFPIFGSDFNCFTLAVSYPSTSFLLIWQRHCLGCQHGQRSPNEDNVHGSDHQYCLPLFWSMAIVDVILMAYVLCLWQHHRTLWARKSYIPFYPSFVTVHLLAILCRCRRQTYEGTHLCHAFPAFTSQTPTIVPDVRDFYILTCANYFSLHLECLSVFFNSWLIVFLVHSTGSYFFHFTDSRFNF